MTRSSHTRAVMLLCAAFAGTALAAYPKQLCGRVIVLTEAANSASLLAGDTGANSTYGYMNAMAIGKESTGPAAGYNDGVCTTFTLNPETGDNTGFCSYNVIRNDWGSIAVTGYFPDVEGSRFDNPIVGGTGIWNGASGVVTVTVLKPGESWMYHVKLAKAGKCA